jgi:membrane-associated phospholipid phosphatase
VPVAADVFETGEGLVNLVAAMPSLHAAYPAMLLLFFWNDGRWWRIGLALYTLAMGFSLVYGGEHFVIDVLVGWLYAGIAYAAVCVAAPALRRAVAVRRGTADRGGQAEPAPSPGAVRL